MKSCCSWNTLLHVPANVASYVPSDQPGREGVLYTTSGNGPREVWFVRQ